jgi:hypothetical protein
MLLEDIQVLDPFCVYQNIPVLFLIYNVVLPYQGIDSILEISYVSVLDNLKRYLHQTSHTV